MTTARLLSTAVLAFALMPAAGARADTPVLHPLKAACVEYEVSGQLQSGSLVRCHRAHGHEQYEIQKVEISISGFKQKTNQHAITIGDTIYAINLDTMQGTKTKNPMYEQIVSSMQNTSAEEMGQRFISAMGFRATGKTKSVAGETCEVYKSAQLGTACIMPNGLMLETSVMGMVQTATGVTIGDGGDDANYKLHETVPITDGPDLSNILKGLQKTQ